MIAARILISTRALLLHTFLPGAYRPTWLVPISHQDAFLVRRLDLLLQYLHLRGVQSLTAHLSEYIREIPIGCQRNRRCDIRKCCVEVGEWSVVEVVAMVDTLDLIQRSIACSNHGYWTGGYASAVPRGQISWHSNGAAVSICLTQSPQGPIASGRLYTLWNIPAARSGSNSRTTCGNVVSPSVFTST